MSEKLSGEENVIPDKSGTIGSIANGNIKMIDRIIEEINEALIEMRTLLNLTIK